MCEMSECMCEIRECMCVGSEQLKVEHSPRCNEII